MNYKIGSMWRKWDLQIHTPYSELNNGYGNDFNKYFHDIYVKAINGKISVIAFTDYFLIDGYKKALEILNDDLLLKEIFSSELSLDSSFIEKVKNITIFPSVEFRTDKTIDSSKAQINVVFSNELTIQQIEDNFLSKITMFESFSDTSSSYTLTRANLEIMGKKYKKQGIANTGQNETDLFVGMNGTHVSLEKLKELKDDSQFKGKVIYILPEEDVSKINWQSQSGNIRKHLYSLVDALFTSNKNTIEWCNSDECEITVGKKLPCLWSSDAHNIEEAFSPYDNRFCWVKADPTYEGLKRSLLSYSNRIYIGEVPTELEQARRRAPYSIEQLKIKKSITPKHPTTWFDSEIIFNPYMISVIGNKGSGKSALVDILSFLGNSKNMSYASFLSDKRFLDKKMKFNEDYNGNLKFYNNKKEIYKDKLYNTVDDLEPEYIKYLPQKYIEEVCNDISADFQSEINECIYSYLPLQDRGSSTDLNSLILERSLSKEGEIISIRSKIEEVNTKIINLEIKKSVKYQQEIRTKLNSQQLKLQNHISIKPIEVIKPSDIDVDSNSQVIFSLQRTEVEIDDKINEKKEHLKELNQQIQKINNLNEKIKLIIQNADILNKEYIELANVLGIDNSYILQLSVRNNALETKQEELSALRKLILIEIDDTNIILDNLKFNKDLDLNYDSIILESNKQKSFINKKEIIRYYILKTNEKSDNESKRYIKYLEELKKWETIKKMMEGSIENTIDGESIKKYQNELNYCNNLLDNDLNLLYTERKTLIINLVNSFSLKKEILESIYKPIQDKINVLTSSQDEKIKFTANIKLDNDFEKQIFDKIDLRTNSSFNNKNLILDKINSCDYNSTEQVSELIYYFLNETKDSDKKIAIDKTKFYNFVAKCEYLKVEYSIMSNDKQLEELSPGERGIILLIFYLALNRGDTPLIIDQPEDNLDNQSIFTRLVPAIIEAKKNRQLILVTHNPNIAIACDAEQIIHSFINKTNNKITYTSGSIENPIIKKHVIDILEGTKPAFNFRNDSYNK